MNRRQFLWASGLALPVVALWQPLRGLAAEADPAKALVALERRHRVHLGLAMLDTHTGNRLQYRARERFPLCSTAKLLLAAAVLARVDRGEEALDRRIAIKSEALLAYAPVTRQRLGAPGMSVAELCHAAITVSDNTAANLLFALLGGPSAATAFARGLGDTVTRLDRNEPELNNVGPGDERDTTSPAAMLGNLQHLLLGNTLTPASRDMLGDWLRACSTGHDQLRAGVPAGWEAGDKTGSSSTASNDVAIFWPPARKPLLMTAYCLGDADTADVRKTALREAATIATAHLAT